jgi:Protein of unknown function (DUF2909)
MKFVIMFALIAVLGALASAGFFMLKKRGDDDSHPDKRMARSLALRVGLSVALFLFILVSWKMGWISPRGIPI